MASWPESGAVPATVSGKSDIETPLDTQVREGDVQALKPQARKPAVASLNSGAGLPQSCVGSFPV